MSPPVTKVSSTVFRNSPGNLVISDIADNDQSITSDVIVKNNNNKNKSSSMDEVMVFPVASAFGLPHNHISNNINNNPQNLKEKKFIHSSSTPSNITTNDEINEKVEE